jgi:hypothetical protein
MTARARRLAGFTVVLGLAAVVGCGLLAFGVALARPEALTGLRPRLDERVLDLPVGASAGSPTAPAPVSSPPPPPAASPPLPTAVATPTPSQYYITCQDGRLIIGTTTEGACAAHGGIQSISLTPPNAPPRPSTDATLSFLVVQGAAPGGQAAVTVQALPGVSCSIIVFTPRGDEITAAGLNNQATDRLGRASWRWTIPASTPVGAGKVRVSCDGRSAETELPIGQ